MKNNTPLQDAGGDVILCCPRCGACGNESKALEQQIAIPEVEVGVRSLYRYATKSDMVIIITGGLCAIVGGAALPLMILFYGRLQGTFQDFSNNAGSPQDAFLSQVNGMVGDFVYLALVEFATIYIAMVGFIYTGERISNQIRKHYLKSCLRQNVGCFDAQLSSGEVTSSITAEIDVIRAGMSEKMALCITAFATFFSAFVISFVAYWKLTLVLLSTVVAMLSVMGVCSAFLVKYSIPWMGCLSQAGVVAGDVIGSIKNTIAFGTEKRLALLYDRHLVDAEVHGYRVKVVSAFMIAGITLVATLNYGLSFWVGSKFLLAGELSVSSVLIILMAVMLGAFDLGNVAPHIQAFNAALSTAKKIYSTIDRLPPPDLDPDAEEGRKLPLIGGAIRFENVRHIYPSRPDVVVLNDFTLEIPAGKTTAIVGSSGSGKSSIIALIERFYNPVGGRITLEGQDIRQLNLKWFRRTISLVEQEPMLSDTTVFENIAQGLIGSKFENESHGRKELLVFEAAKKAFAHDFICGLNDGYQTRVGERGGRLSGGQRQRIAIARSIISEPKILLLDEATSALDSTSERAVQAALKTASVGRTTIAVAHRLSTIQDADQIVVMAAGSIVEKGTHSELIALRGAYFKLVEAQSASQPDDDEKFDEDASDSDAGSMDDIDLGEKQQETAVALSQDVKPEVPKYGLWTLMKLIASLNRQEWKLMAWGCFWSLVCGAGNPTNAFLLGKQIMVLSAPVVDEKVKRESDFYSVMYVVMAVVLTFAFLAQGIAFARCSERLIHRVRERAFRTILRQEMAYFDRTGTAALLTFLSTRASEVAGLSGSVLGIIITAISTLVGSVILSLAIGWKLSLVCMVSIPVLLACGFLRFHMLYRFEQRAKAGFEKTATEASEAVAAIRTVAALTREKDVLDRYYRTLDEQQRASLRSILSSSALYAASQSMFFLAFALGFWYGGLLIARGEYTQFQFFVCFAAIVFGTQSTGTIFSYAREMGQARQAATEMKALFDNEVTIDTWSDAGAPIDHQFLEGALEFRDVNFTYPTARHPSLKKFSLHIKPGQSVAFVGSSGSGKSTALSLIERMYDPDSGMVCLDGQDIRSINVNQYRSIFALVSQQAVLYRGTIRENILLGTTTPENVTEEDMRAVCREADIESFVSSLPDGLDTAVGGNGVLLSGGQKQRIALARALVRKPRVLLLDEATSALDVESERSVQAALDRASASRTTISVAHRLSTVRRCDLIVVMDGGRTVEVGNHQELMRKNGMYAQMAKLQEMAP